MSILKELLAGLLSGVERAEDLPGDQVLMKELKVKLMERMLVAELTAHLGYEEGEVAPAGQSNGTGRCLLRSRGTVAAVLSPSW